MLESFIITDLAVLIILAARKTYFKRNVFICCLYSDIADEIKETMSEEFFIKLKSIQSDEELSQIRVLTNKIDELQISQREPHRHGQIASL